MNTVFLHEVSSSQWEQMQESTRGIKGLEGGGAVWMVYSYICDCMCPLKRSRSCFKWWFMWNTYKELKIINEDPKNSIGRIELYALWEMGSNNGFLCNS